MATTTPNFGWPVPTSTDYVKNGATAIEGLGDAIDASLVYLKGGTTGQVLSKTSNTDMAFTWVTQDDANAIQNAIVDAKGDLIGATANDTPARIPVGTNGQVLTADSTATAGVSWQTPASGIVTWTIRQTAGITGSSILTIAYNGSNLYVAAGQSGVLYTSPDGKTWTSRTSGFGANAIWKVAYGNGLWVAVGVNGTITTSSDGITWTARTANMGTNTIYDVHYANATWVAVGNGGGANNTGGITYSTDGVTWTRKSQTPTIGTTYAGVIYNGTNWIVVASVSTNNYLYAATPDGTWTAGQWGGGAVSSGMYGVWYDGTRTIGMNASNGSLVYSTSSTIASSNSYDNTALVNYTVGTGQNVTRHYNGRIYTASAIYTSFNTTPGATNANCSTDVSTPVFVPGAAIDANSLASWTHPITALLVTSAGAILGGTKGAIWTSF